MEKHINNKRSPRSIRFISCFFFSAKYFILYNCTNKVETRKKRILSHLCINLFSCLGNNELSRDSSSSILQIPILYLRVCFVAVFSICTIVVGVYFFPVCLPIESVSNRRRLRVDAGICIHDPQSEYSIFFYLYPCTMRTVSWWCLARIRHKRPHTHPMHIKTIKLRSFYFFSSLCLSVDFLKSPNGNTDAIKVKWKSTSRKKSFQINAHCMLFACAEIVQ